MVAEIDPQQRPMVSKYMEGKKKDINAAGSNEIVEGGLWGINQLRTLCVLELLDHEAI